ncbi:amino acid synthesis family protein [Octadecabacter antarcticus]
MVPLMDKNDTARRSHYLTIQFAIPDAPRLLDRQWDGL